MCGAATIMPERVRPEVHTIALVRVHPHDPCGTAGTAGPSRWPARPGRPGRGRRSRSPRCRRGTAPRRPQSRTNASSDAPIRVPPSQSKTASAACSSASSAPAVLQLPGDAGEPGAEAEHLDLCGRARRWPSRRTAAGCGSSRPSSRRRPGSGSAGAAAAGGGARTARPGSPCMRNVSRAPYAAGPAPGPAGAASVRRVRRRGGVSRIRLHDPAQRRKLLRRAGREGLGTAASSASEATRPSRVSCSSRPRSPRLGLRAPAASPRASARDLAR